MRVNRVLIGGAFWTAAGEILNGVVTLGSGILAARLLSKHDFGLMGTVMLWLAILEHFSHTGFDAALVQKKEDVTSYMDVAWTWHLLRGAVIAGLLCLGAPFISRWYGEPAVLSLMLAISAAALLAGANNVGQIFFTRDLEFRTLFYIKAAQTLTRLLVFVPAVLYLRNVWALVIGHLSGSLLNLIISYIAHPYRPKLRWNRAKLKELIKYGKWLTGLAVIGFFIGKGDDLFVSKYLGIVALGIYQLSYDVSNMPTINITHVIGRIGFPVYAKLQNDVEALRDTFVKVMRVTLMLSGPVSAFIFVEASDFVHHVLGAKWAPTIPLIRILVISGFIRSIAALAGPLFQGTGRPDLDFKMNTPRFLCVVLLIYPAAKHWGLEGVCWVVVIAISTCLPTWLWGVRKLTKISFGALLRHNGLALLATVVLLASMYAVRYGVASTSLQGSFVGALSSLAGGLAVWLAALAVIGKLSPWNIFGEVSRLRQALRKTSKETQETS